MGSDGAKLAGRPFGIAASVVSALGRAGWMLLLPFGFVNVAYWSRAIPAPQAHGRGARSVRVFGLGLTLLFVTTAATVGLDLVGTQCFRDSGAAASVAAHGGYPRTGAYRRALRELIGRLG